MSKLCFVSMVIHIKKRLLYKLLLLIITSFSVALIVYASASNTEQVNIYSENGMEENSYLKDGTIIRYLNLRVVLGSSYFSDYSNGYSQAASDLVHLHYPFSYKYGLSFFQSYTNFANTMIDNCTNPTGQACSCVPNASCINSLSTNFHHKNGVKNLTQFISWCPTTGYDLFVFLVDGPLCYKNSGNHYPVYGLSYIGNKYAICDQLPAYSNILKVRILQHEISHMFGCQDGVCTSGSQCIMNDGYDGTSLYYVDIWCSSCYSDFDPTLH